MLENSKNVSGNILTFSILGLALCAAPAWAQSALEISDGTNSITISSTGAKTYGGSCTATKCPTTFVSASTTSIAWSGTVGIFTIGTSSASGVQGQVVGTPNIDLGLTSASTTGAGTLYVWFTSEFLSGTGPFNISATGAPGSSPLSFSTYVGSAAFAATTTIATYGLQGATEYSATPAIPFYLTTKATVPMVVGSTPNFDGPAFGTASSSTGTNPLSLSCPGATGQVGVAYNSSLVALGGTPPYNYSIVGGSISPFLLNAGTGAITGTPTTAGTLSFTAQVVDSSGISGTNTVSQSCGVVVSPSTPLAKGDTATIGFWHNKNGQALIDSLNGGPNSTSLANWLATSFPYLYGAHSSNNLTGETNSDVAALFMTFFGVSGQKTDAQIMSGALASYVTDSTLAGTNAIPYGFNSSPGGTGAKSYNVGSNGSALGLTNNQSYTVLQLLLQANLDMANGTFNANTFNTIFDGINSGGDI